MKALNPVDIMDRSARLYSEVYGDREKLSIYYDGMSYDILDRYCVNPECPCSHVILHFLSYKSHFAVRMNIKNKKIEILELENITEEKARRVYKFAMKDSDEAIRVMKRHFKEMKEAGKAALKDVITKDELAKKLPERNAPCPCGSGKKFKKCCGAVG